MLRNALRNILEAESLPEQLESRKMKAPDHRRAPEVGTLQGARTGPTSGHKAPASEHREPSVQGHKRAALAGRTGPVVERKEVVPEGRR